ncbi:MAG: P-type conjugative transfer protein TrbL [Nitrosomonas sp.]|jgi:type IV secretion system protein TrbL|nr:P-type conjugative transfer protein TrbL [Nitrosomonas sp.]
MSKDKLPIFVAALILMFFASSASYADLSFIDPATGDGVLDQVMNRFYEVVKNWQNVLQAAATKLFWTLALMSMVWMGAMLLLRRGEITDFFVEFTRFIIFTGFFFWLLTNAVSGHNIAGTIISSMQQLGGNASASSGVSPSSIINVGMYTFLQTIEKTNIIAEPLDSLVAYVLALGILIISTVIAVNMLLLLIASWVLLYAGIFLLGFGGARWTSDIALNYFKTVLAIGIQLLVMTLIVGIGGTILTEYFNKMSKNLVNYEELAVMLVFTIAFFVLVNRLPQMVSSIVTYSGNGAVGGIGSSYSPQGLAATGVSAAAATATAGVAAAYGANAAINYLKAHNHMSSGPDSGDSFDRANEINQFTSQDYNLNQSDSKNEESPYPKGHYLYKGEK